MILRKAKSSYSLGKDNQSISHLLYMDDLKLYAKDQREIDSLINTVAIFSKDIKMEFGLKKCGVLVLKRGKVSRSEGIEIPGEGKIKSVSEEGYKYLGILEFNDMLHGKMKEGMRKEYFRRVKKILKSKLNGRNSVMALNTWAVAVMRYGAGVIDWRVMELRDIDRKTRKLMAMYGMLHPRADVERLYLPRVCGGRGLIGVEDCVRLEEIGLAYYIQNSNEQLLRAVGDEGLVTSDQVQKPKIIKEKQRKERLESWTKKPLHGQILRQTEEVRGEKSWDWLRKGDLKKGTEGLITAAQDQALRTNAVKAKIEKSSVSSLCRMCGSKDETVSHIICECSKLAQRQYKQRHDNVARIIHWSLCKIKNLPFSEKWYEHTPESVIEEGGTKLFWDFTVQTDHEIQARRPDIVLLDRKAGQCYIIDIAVPGDARILEKEKEKIEKYQDLRRETARLWDIKVKVVPIVIGALGMVTKNLNMYLETLGIGVRTELLQKAALLGTARILRNVLEA